ncbi:hypothetical protein HK099_000960 [Clydaea vesicula]|uniref:DH domain-containing protein n=1 Tax=Clydaea vesicula TaxID=447962 RepID=A0AAD5TW34_9FUNG|nr:hypothetical protein HK099_000960 [Clydaea vesicula]KAJ3377873.1 hypothetical protein HDU92_007897 [Lobulomyces angularis]
MSIYNDYCYSYLNSLSLLAKLEKSKPFQLFLKDFGITSNEKLEIRDYLILPIQRICRYQIFLNELLKRTKSLKMEQNVAELEIALEIAKQTTKSSDLIIGYYKGNNEHNEHNAPLRINTWEQQGFHLKNNLQGILSKKNTIYQKGRSSFHIVQEHKNLEKEKHISSGEKSFEMLNKRFSVDISFLACNNSVKDLSDKKQVPKKRFSFTEWVRNKVSHK